MAVSKLRGNMLDPEFLAQWEPWRASIRPPQCHLGEQGICWVKDPYTALSRGGGTFRVRCHGCKGIVGRAGRHPGGSDAV